MSLIPSIEKGQQRLAFLRKEYGSLSCPYFWNLPEALVENNSSNNGEGVLDALLHQASFASGKVPDAFESVKTTGSGKVICVEMTCCENKDKITLSFTSNSKGRLKMYGEGTFGIWTEEIWGNDIRKWRSGVNLPVSVTLKRTPVYLVQKNKDDSTLVKFMTNYYRWMWCLSEKGLNTEQGLVRRIAEFVGPAPVFWLEEGDILTYSRIFRPRKKVERH